MENNSNRNPVFEKEDTFGINMIRLILITILTIPFVLLMGITFTGGKIGLFMGILPFLFCAYLYVKLILDIAGIHVLKV